MAISRAALADYFRRRAVERVAEIRTLRESLRSPDTAAEDTESAVRTLAHQLAGTAAGFGFPAVGHLAKEVELAPPERLTTSLDTLLAALEAVAAPEERDAPPDTE